MKIKIIFNSIKIIYIIHILILLFKKYKNKYNNNDINLKLNNNYKY